MNSIRHTKSQSFMGNVAIVLLAQLMVKLLGMVYRMVITNIEGFGDAGNGFYNAGFQIYTVLLAISSIGIPNAIAKMVSERIALDDYKGAHSVFKTAFILFAGIGVFFSAFLFFGAEALATYVIGQSEVQYVMRALAPSIFFVCVSSVIRGYFQGLNDMNATSKSQILEQFFKCILTIALVVFTVGSMPYLMQLATKFTMLYNKDLSKTPPEIMAAWANMASTIATLISFAYLVVFYTKRKREIHIKIQKSHTSTLNVSTGQLVRSILMISIPISLASIITALNRVIDTATIARGIEIAFANKIPAYGNFAAIINPTKSQLSDYAMILAGRLSKSDTLINLPLALNVAFSTVLVPSISGALAKGDTREASNKITYSFLISSLLILPCAIGLIVLAQPIYKLIYPNASLGSDLLALMSVSLIFSALIQTMSGALQGMGKVLVPAYGLIVGCIIKIILNIILIRIPSINIYGAAISSIVCQIAAFIVCFAVLSKHLKINISFSKYIARPLIAGIIMGFFAYFSYEAVMYFTNTNIVSIFVSIAVAVIIYAFMIVVLKVLNSDEIKMLPGGEKLYSILNKMKLYK